MKWIIWEIVWCVVGGLGIVAATYATVETSKQHAAFEQRNP
jgi:hypothetical protein